ncbi:MAG: tRNA pseudouridine(38-40) synthase TruA [Cyclobacteriaceae bacterium]|nr:tRNA pseudouridine(38-40) synthase TruA [Cyclobacteriaceae bacterium]
MDPFNKSYFYLIELQYLGFRYHGWLKQPDVKTIQGMVIKTLRYVLGDISFKTLGSSRTDAMVSVNSTTFELFTKQEIDTDWLLKIFNKNLPQDIRAVSINETDEKFNIIQAAKQKEYLYLFSYGTKNHPFSAPFITCLQEELDVEIMKNGAILFEGRHDFRQYCYKPSELSTTDRKIEYSKIIPNDMYTANFFPKNSYAFRVMGEGFMHHQIRLMMGALIMLGKKEIELEDVELSLSGGKVFEQYVAPASGLILNSVTFD